MMFDSEPGKTEGDDGEGRWDVTLYTPGRAWGHTLSPSRARVVGLGLIAAANKADRYNSRIKKLIPSHDIVDEGEG